MAALIACQNVKFKGYAVRKKCQSLVSIVPHELDIFTLDKHNQSLSLSEKTALASLEHHAVDFILNNQCLLTRVYPSAYRQNSKFKQQMGSNRFRALSFEVRISDCRKITYPTLSFWNTTGVQMG